MARRRIASYLSSLCAKRMGRGTARSAVEGPCGRCAPPPSLRDGPPPHRLRRQGGYGFNSLALCLPLLASHSHPSQRPQLTPTEPTTLSTRNGLYLGADLSYVNEMEDCGAVYRDRDGRQVDPFALMAARGGNLVRVRLWNNPTWTRYSNLEDVKRTIRRARAAGMQVLLNFHYSDDWADGDKQHAPAAWVGLDDEATARALHDFTLETLRSLHADGLMPELVQVGNETNPEIVGGEIARPINWTRNALLLNAGIRAVREAGRETGTRPKLMLHIAQPENVEPWFDAATLAGVIDYDLIGISYYRKWSRWTLAQLGETIARVRGRYRAEVMLVETAYPFTNDGDDEAANLLGPDTLIPGYPATPEGQLRYLTDITQTRRRQWRQSASSIGSRPGSRPAAAPAGAPARTGRMPPGSACVATRRCRPSISSGVVTRRPPGPETRESRPMVRPAMGFGHRA